VGLQKELTANLMTKEGNDDTDNEKLLIIFQPTLDKISKFNKSTEKEEEEQRLKFINKRRTR